MVIFHSYVRLPEGNRGGQRKHVTLGMGYHEVVAIVICIVTEFSQEGIACHDRCGSKSCERNGILAGQKQSNGFSPQGQTKITWQMFVGGTPTPESSYCSFPRRLASSHQTRELVWSEAFGCRQKATSHQLHQAGALMELLSGRKIRLILGSSGVLVPLVYRSHARPLDCLEAV